MYSLPRIYHKLHTNARLTSREEDRVRRSRREMLIRLEAVEGKTARLRDSLSILHQRKKENEEYIHVHRVLISPIRRLLPEILQEIFWWCLPAAHNSVFSFEEAPLLLGRVCSQWHKIAYSTPKLWSSLHMVVVPLTSPQAEARFEAFEAWLARSGILPLYISMAPMPQNRLWPDVSLPYFDLIAKYARQLKSIHLHPDLLDPFHLFRDLHGNDLPLLETLYIHSTAYTHDDTEVHCLFKENSILFAPLLRILSLREYGLPLLHFPVQWSQLTSLDLIPQPVEASDVFEILNFCSNLETCSIGFESFLLSPVSDTRSSIIILSKLRTLEILEIHGVLVSPHDSLTLLKNLYTPVLRHFTYRHLSSPSLWIIPPFTELSSSLEIFCSFFQRLNEPLEELDFVSGDLGMRYLIRLLSLFPELKRLSLRATSVSPAFPVNNLLLLKFIPHEYNSRFRLCSPSGDEDFDPVIPSPPFCPKLETFYVENAVFTKRVLFKFLRSRLVDYGQHNFVCLRRLTISCKLPKWDDDGDISTEEIDRLAEESGVVDMRLGILPSSLVLID